MSELFDEVDEEVRREQLKKLWDKYSIYIIALALLIIAGVGGWRGYQQALIEPWTGYPSPLADAVTSGRARQLAPGERESTRVTAIVYDGVEQVAELRPDGTVLP